jgi:hypothetical protein
LYEWACQHAGVARTGWDGHDGWVDGFNTKGLGGWTIHEDV